MNTNEQNNVRENDYETKAKEIINNPELSIIGKAVYLIALIDKKSVLSADERNLVVEFAYKLNDIERTKQLTETLVNQGSSIKTESPAFVAARAEIDSFPDIGLGMTQMNEYGYLYDGILPLQQSVALELYHSGLEVLCLYQDNTEAIVETESSILNHDGMFGIEKETWEKYQSRKDKSIPISDSDMTYLENVAESLYQKSTCFSEEQSKEEFIEAVRESAMKNGYEKTLGALKDLQNEKSEPFHRGLSLEISE